MIQSSFVVPGTGLIAIIAQVWAIIHAEVVMQWRRWGFWITFGIAVAILFLIFGGMASTIKNPVAIIASQSTIHRAVTQTDIYNYFVGFSAIYSDLILALVSAFLVADRLVRDQQLGVTELQQATTLGYPLYILGKFVGNLTATLLPSFCAYVLFGIFFVILGAPPAILLLFPSAFLLALFPSFAVVVAVTLFLSSILPVRAVQIGFPLLWIFSIGSFLGWPTLVNTVFNPSGLHILNAFFPTIWYPYAQTREFATLNIVILLLVTVVSLILLMISLTLRQYIRFVGIRRSKPTALRVESNKVLHTPLSENAASFEYKSTSSTTLIPLREAFLLIKYHLRLLNWWLLLVMLLGFVGSGAMLWLVLNSGGQLATTHGNEFSRFILELGASLIAIVLTSVLVVGDPGLEVIMVTQEGISRVLIWRYLITLCVLFICAAGYLIWSLLLGVTYTVPQTALTLFMVWFAPVFVMSMLSMLTSLIARNAALGVVIAAIPLMSVLLFHNDLVNIMAAHLWVRVTFLGVFFPYTLWGFEQPGWWWANRLLLIVEGLLLIYWSWWCLRKEERLLGKLQ